MNSFYFNTLFIRIVIGFVFYFSSSMSVMAMGASGSADSADQAVSPLSVPVPASISDKDLTDLFEQHMIVVPREIERISKQEYIERRKESFRKIIRKSDDKFERDWKENQGELADFIARAQHVFDAFERFCASADECYISRDVKRIIYPTRIHPYFEYFQRNFITPLFKKLGKVEIIDPSASFGLVPIDPSEKVIWAFMKDSTGKYLSTADQLHAHTQLLSFTTGLENVDFQSVAVIQDGKLVVDRGFIAEYRDSSHQLVRVQGYHGNNSPYFKVYPVTANIDPFSSVFGRFFSRLLDENPREKYVFMALPSTKEEKDYVELALLEDLCAAPADEQRDAGLLLGDLITPDLLSIEEAQAAILPQAVDGAAEEAHQEVDGAASKKVEILPAQEERSFSASLEEYTERQGRSILDAIIQEEQQKIREAVAKGSIIGRKAKAPRGAGGSKSKHTRQIADSTPQLESPDSIRLRAREILKENLASTRVKYRGLLELLRNARRDLLHAARKEDIAAELSSQVTREGSHSVQHDSLGAFTIIRPHGGDRLIAPKRTNRILDRYLQGIAAELTRLAERAAK